MNRLFVSSLGEKACPGKPLGPAVAVVLAMWGLGCGLLASNVMAAPRPASEAASTPGAPGFAGNWEIDLRTPAERQAQLECGHAYFQLEQRGSEILGEHGYATPGCGQSQIGGPVHGRVKGREALLEVGSPKQGALVRGKATLVKGQLKWQTLEVVQPAAPAGALMLILPQGVLKRVPAQNFD